MKLPKHAEVSREVVHLFTDCGRLPWFTFVDYDCEVWSTRCHVELHVKRPTSSLQIAYYAKTRSLNELLVESRLVGKFTGRQVDIKRRIGLVGQRDITLTIYECPPICGYILTFDINGFISPKFEVSLLNTLILDAIRKLKLPPPTEKDIAKLHMVETARRMLREVGKAVVLVPGDLDYIYCMSVHCTVTSPIGYLKEVFEAMFNRDEVIDPLDSRCKEIYERVVTFIRKYA